MNNNTSTTDVVRTQGNDMVVSGSAYFSTLEAQKEMAKIYSMSTMVPKQYQGNIGNCVIAIDMSMRLKANPLMVMQNLYVVNGNPAWSSKFLISCINLCGRFTPLRFQFVGKRNTEQYACRAYAYEKSDKERKDCLVGTWITTDMAKREGWSTKPGSKWMTMTDQMMMYRAAAFWARIYAPEISMGIMTKEEVEDAVIVDDMVVAPIEDGQEPEPEIDFSAEPMKEAEVKVEVKPAATDAKPADMIAAAIKNNQTLFAEEEIKEEA